MIKYTQTHEWIDTKTGRVGVTSHAIELLGDVVFIELPEETSVVGSSDSVAVIESHKAASDIYAPMSGKVIEGNQEIVDAPDDIDSSKDLWLFTIEISDAEEADQLMDQAAYEKFIESE